MLAPQVFVRCMVGLILSGADAHAAKVSRRLCFFKKCRGTLVHVMRWLQSLREPTRHSSSGVDGFGCRILALQCTPLVFDHLVMVAKQPFRRLLSRHAKVRRVFAPVSRDDCNMGMHRCHARLQLLTLRASTIVGFENRWRTTWTCLLSA